MLSKSRAAAAPAGTAAPMADAAATMRSHGCTPARAAGISAPTAAAAPTALSCLDAFSSREPVPTSLENATSVFHHATLASHERRAERPAVFVLGATTLPWRGRVGSHEAKRNVRRGGVKVAQLGN